MTRAETRARIRANKNKRRAAQGLPPLPDPPPPNKIGRPTLFTPERRAELLRHVNVAPLGLKQLADAVGISVACLLDWVHRGEEAGPDNPDVEEASYYEFAMAFKSARAKRFIVAEGRIHQAAQEPRHWQAAAWLLERAYPQVYGRPPVRIEHSGPDGSPMVITDEARMRRLQGIVVALQRTRAEDVPPGLAGLLRPTPSA